jgi:hypothetical protein
MPDLSSNEVRRPFWSRPLARAIRGLVPGPGCVVGARLVVSERDVEQTSSFLDVAGLASGEDAAAQLRRLRRVGGRSVCLHVRRRREPVRVELDVDGGDEVRFRAGGATCHVRFGETRGAPAVASLFVDGGRDACYALHLPTDCAALTLVVNEVPVVERRWPAGEAAARQTLLIDWDDPEPRVV